MTDRTASPDCLRIEIVLPRPRPGAWLRRVMAAQTGRAASASSGSATESHPDGQPLPTWMLPHNLSSLR